MITKNDLSFYIHYPYCTKKCGYCDFISFDKSSPKYFYTKNNWCALIIKEIDLYKAFSEDKNIISIYFGGGTPSLLKPNEIKKIISKIKDNCGTFSQNIEITIECNLDTLSHKYINQLSNIGVNRISIGVQSVNKKTLQTLKREHDVQKIDDIIFNCKKSNLSTNIDLIYGTPFETMEDFSVSINTVVKLDVDHVSCYGLTISKDSKIFDVAEHLNNDSMANMYLYADSVLNKNGYLCYEISNWTKNAPSVHNNNYWHGGNWVGIGVGAYGSINNMRYCNTNNPFNWENTILNNTKPHLLKEKITIKERLLERIMLGLRLSCGIKKTDIKNYLSFEYENDLNKHKIVFEKIDDFIHNNLMSYKKSSECNFCCKNDGDQKSFILTPKGRIIADYIIREII